MAGSYTFTAHDPSAYTDDEVRELSALGAAVQAEFLPDDPPPDPELSVAAHHSRPARLRRWAFRARDQDGRLVGWGGASLDPEHDDNPDLLGVNLSVHPDVRRQGVGRRLLAGLVDVAESEGRRRIVGETVPDGLPFVEAMGGRSALAESINHLPVDECDRVLMETWVAEGPERAADYELVWFDDGCPDEHLEGLIHTLLVLNDAPRDDLDVNDFTLTPTQVRETEEREAKMGLSHWNVLARHRTTGAYAGIHDIIRRPDNPEVMWVGATTVDPAHRGHALGKWMKAAMMLRIMDERPEVRDIRTGNAATNDAMLGINHAMGYRLLLTQHGCIADTADVRGRLDAAGVRW